MDVLAYLWRFDMLKMQLGWWLRQSHRKLGTVRALVLSQCAASQNVSE